MSTAVVVTLPDLRARPLPRMSNFERGGLCCQLSRLGVDGDGAEMFKPHYGTIRKVERRTCCVVFDGEGRERRVKKATLYVAPETKPSVLKIARTPDTDQVFALPSEAGHLATVVAPDSVVPALVKVPRPEPEQAPTPTPVQEPQAMHTVPHHDSEPAPPSSVANAEPTEQALETLEAWLELGDGMIPALKRMRADLMGEIEDRRRKLNRIDNVLIACGGAPPEPTPSRPRRSAERSERVRALIRQTLAVKEGVNLAALAEGVQEHDASIDRYDVNNVLSSMYKKDEVVRQGTRGSYAYFLPPRTSS